MTSAWKLWTNPILRRYCRARLRPYPLAATLLVTLIITGFVFFMARTASMHRGGMLVVDAERLPIPFLLVIQALILFFLGTGQVAGGITGEADEGVLDYQRLSPMTPLAKTLGYLFGLPVREWLMFAVTLPFSVWCFWRGKVPLASCVSVYVVFCTSAVLYHLTGLTAGLVIKNRRWAFLMSMFIILLLYTVMPQVSKMGLLFFDYVTVWPVLDEHMHNFLPREVGGAVKIINMLTKHVSFFDLQFSELVFTLFCQAGLILTLGMMVWRRWRRVESHLLSKGWALGLFVWLQTLLLGNALPLIEPGLLFPSKTLALRFMNAKTNWQPKLNEGIAIVGAYGLTTLLIMLSLIAMITPSAESQLRGLLRARKLALPRVPLASDAASAWGWALAVTLAGACVWFLFARALMSSHWFPGHELPSYALPVFVMVMLNSAMAFHALMEGWGTKKLFVAAVFIGVVPPLIAFVLGTSSDGLMPVATWLAAVSPGSGPTLAAATLVPDADLPRQVSRAVPRAFGFWQGMLLCGTIWLTVRLRALHRQRRTVMMRNDE